MNQYLISKKSSQQKDLFITKILLLLVFLSFGHVNEGNHQIFKARKITPLFKSYEKMTEQ